MAESARPLDGWRVVVTRSPRQAPALAARLRAQGAEPLLFPVIRFVPLAAPTLLQASAALGAADWLLLTSANAVRFLLERLAAAGVAVPAARVAAIGSATARHLVEKGIEPDVVPEEFVAERLVEALGPLAGRRVLLPRSRRGRPEITRMLRERGAIVDDLPLYDTVRADPDPAAIAALREGVQMITFTSPSSVRNFLAIATEAGLTTAELANAAIGCLGPVTAAEARRNGLPVAVVPERYTIDDLVAAIAAHAANRGESVR